MKAITITQQLKDLNVELFKNNEIGFIRQFKEIPKSFFSLNYNLGKRTDGYNTLDNSVHESDGFFNLITPVINPLTQKITSIYFNVDHFTYNVEPLNQNELNNKIKEDFKNSLEGAFSFVMTPDGTKEYALRLGNDGKIFTTLVP